MAWLRMFRLLVGIGWEIGPAVSLTYVGVNVSALVAPLLLAVGLRPIVDGVVFARSGQIAMGVTMTATALMLSVLAPAAYRWATIRMRELSIMVMQRRILDLSTAAPGLDHFERPEFWDRLQLLKRNSHDLGMGLAVAFMGVFVVAQLVVTAALVAPLQPVLICLPVVAVPAAWLARRAEVVRRDGELRTAEDRRSAQHLFALASASAPGKELRLYGLQAELLRRHRQASGAAQRHLEAALIRSVAVSAGGWLIFAVAYVGAVVLVLREAAFGQVTPGDVALTLALATALVTAAARVSELAGDALRVRSAAEHYQWLDEHARFGREGRIQPAPRLKRGIELDGITFGYAESESPTLYDLSLRIPAGAVVAVVGENGAGKTTLAKLLCGMYAPTAGRILIDGVDLAAMDVKAYREKLTAGFQDFMRFELTIREAVGVGDLQRVDDVDAVRAALARANADFTGRLPDGLETQLGPSWQGGIDLSGGEWQMLSLARSMVRPAPLLTILDEPTASLDPQSEHALFEQVASDSRRAGADGGITLLISHRFSTVQMADLIVVLDRGRLLEQGTHEELLAYGGLYAEIYQLQAWGYR